MGARSFEIRGNLESEYPDVFTREAMAAIEVLSKLDAERKAVLAGRTARRAARSRNKERIDFLDPSATIGANQHQGSGCARRQFHRHRDPRRPAAGSGFKAPARPPSRMRRSKRASATSPMRCCPAPTAGCSTARTRSARSATMSLDNQRNLKLAIHRDPVFMKVAEQVAGEMNAVGTGFLRHARSSTTGKSSSTSRPRSSAPAACTSTTATSATSSGAGFSASIVDATLYIVNNHRRLREDGVLAGSLPAQDPDRRGGRAVERHPLGARTAPRPAGRHHQGLRARRAGRSVFPADGDSRRPRASTSSASTPAAGTTSTASPTPWPGTRNSSTRTSTPSR